MLLKNYKWLSNSISFLLIILFVYTGASKLLDNQTFYQQLKNTPFLTPVAGFTSVALPVTEILTGTSIAFSVTHKTGMWAAATLMTIFTSYVSIMLMGDKTKLPCSCGGIIKSMSWTTHLWFNIIFMILAWLNIKLTGIRTRE